LFNKKHIWFLKFLIGFFILFGIFIRLDVAQVIIVLQKAKLDLLLTSMMLSILLISLKSYRWLILLKQQDIAITYWNAFRIYSIGNFLGILTPARLGEFTKVFFIKPITNKFNYTGSTISILFDRLFDFFTLSTVSIVGGVLLFNWYYKTILYKAAPISSK